MAATEKLIYRDSMPLGREVPELSSRWVIDRAGLARLCAELAADGYSLVGPTVRENAVIYAEINGLEDLPQGMTDEQEPGRYRLKNRSDKALFDYVVGPHSWKKFLFPPEVRLLSARRTGRSLSFEEEPLPKEKYAFLAVRACELAAIAIQDKVFMAGSHVDPYYAAIRKEAFLISVQCTQSGGNCFCVSMGTGPKAERGFDLALTERITPDGSDFLVEVGTLRAARLLARVHRTPASQENIREAESAVERCATTMKKKMDPSGIKELLYSNLEHPRWNDAASRCLSCANCTMVCPTCFCSTVEETGDLEGDHAERWRRWDSCFTNDFSYIHGGSVRANTRAKYRQWMTHKLGAWLDQFGSSGCVGCGRCITWCPPGIDITEEVRAIRAVPNEEADHGKNA